MQVFRRSRAGPASQAEQHLLEQLVHVRGGPRLVVNEV